MIEIEKAENGYIIYHRIFEEGESFPIRTLKFTFANLESALSFVRRHFEGDEE